MPPDVFDEIESPVGDVFDELKSDRDIFDELQPEGEFLDREAAAQGTQIPTVLEPGRLHSTDLAQMQFPRLPETATLAEVLRQPEIQIGPPKGIQTPEQWAQEQVAVELARQHPLAGPEIAEQIIEKQEPPAETGVLSLLGISGLPMPEEGAPVTPKERISMELAMPELTRTLGPEATATLSREVYNLAAAIPDFFTSLPGLAAVIGGRVAPTATTAFFTADMLKSLGNQIYGTYKNWGQMSFNDKLKAFVDMVGTGVMTYGLGKHTAKGLRKKLDTITKTQAAVPIEEELPTPRGAVPESIAEVAKKRTLTPAVRADENTNLQTVSESHGTAKIKMAREHATIPTKPQNEGFIDENGNWLSRTEAIDRFRELTGQEPADPNRLTSEDFRGFKNLMDVEQKPTPKPEIKPSEKVKAEKPKIITADEFASRDIGITTPEEISALTEEQAMELTKAKYPEGSPNAGQPRGLQRDGIVYGSRLPVEELPKIDALRKSVPYGAKQVYYNAVAEGIRGANNLPGIRATYDALVKSGDIKPPTVTALPAAELAPAKATGIDVIDNPNPDPVVQRQILESSIRQNKKKINEWKRGPRAETPAIRKQIAAYRNRITQYEDALKALPVTVSKPTAVLPVEPVPAGMGAAVPASTSIYDRALSAWRENKSGRVFTGEWGETHGDVAKKVGRGFLTSDRIRSGEIEQGFTTPSGEFITVQEFDNGTKGWFQSYSGFGRFAPDEVKFSQREIYQEQKGMGAAVPAEFARPEQARAFRGFSGWTGKVKEVLQQLKAYMTPPEAGALPEVEIQHNAVLPRLPAYEVEKQIAASPHGMARVPGLGALFDPRAVAHSPADAVFLARANSVAKGKTFAALWAQTQWRNRELFPVNKQTGTFRLADGREGYLSDVIEAELRDPGSQPLTHAQWKWIHEEWRPILDEINRMMHNEGIRRISTEDMDFELGKDYFPRPAIGKRNRPVRGTGGRPAGRPGAKQFFERGRKYATEEEGARPSTPEAPKEEIIYDPDPISRVSKFISGAYRSIADHRMANDPALGAGTVPEYWGVGRRTMAGPAFAGKIYPEEIAGKIEQQFAQDVRGWVRGTGSVTSAAKALMATADLSGPYIQGAAMFGRHPNRWARSTWNSYRALLDPTFVARLMEHPRYKRLSEAFSQSGGSLLQLQDFLVGLRPGQLATEVPGYGRILVATGRAYGAFLDLAKLELFDAWSKGTPKSEWPRIAESIENSLFMGRMEQVGMNPHRAVGERLLLFAPSYYRGAGGLLATAFQRGLSGKMARQMLGSYAAAATLIPLSAYLAMGMDEEEILQRLNPTKGKFLKVPIELGDGKRIEVGMGNVLTQLVRLSGQAMQYHTTDKPIDTGVEANPYLLFLRGRAAFIPGVAIELATGRDYFGQRISATESVARHFAPFVFQAMFPRDKAAFEQRAADAAFTFFGLNSYPEGEYERNLKLMNDMAQRIGKKPFGQLTIPERARVVAQFKRSPGYKEREVSPTDMERIIHINAGRQMALQKEVGDQATQKLAKAGLKVPGYKSTIRVKGVDVPMTERERLRYEQLLAMFYKARIARINEAALARMPLSEREKRWSKTAEQIGEDARARLVQEINSKQIK